MIRKLLSAAAVCAMLAGPAMAYEPAGIAGQLPDGTALKCFDLKTNAKMALEQAGLDGYKELNAEARAKAIELFNSVAGPIALPNTDHVYIVTSSQEYQEVFFAYGVTLPDVGPCIYVTMEVPRSVANSIVGEEASQ